MIKVGIIGCGKQADAHLVEIQKLPHCEIVGVCDREEVMAKQLYERFKVKKYFRNVTQLLEETQPNVIHIITPPHSHLELGKICLNAGCNVLFEKPFALNLRQAEELIRIAEEKKVKLTVGHNNQFGHAMMRMRQLIETGFLGGPPVHLESLFCYDLGDRTYARAFLGDKTHWVRGLPGKLLHNIISHGISKIAEFINSDSPKVIAFGFRSALLRDIGETEIIDELRAIIYDNEDATAYFTFSTQIGPKNNEFRVFGPRNSLIVNETHQTLIKVSRTDYKLYLNHFIPPYSYGRQYFHNGWNNIKQFIKSDFHYEAGRNHLIKTFYHSIFNGGHLPIPYKEILLTSKIMDDIFAQIYDNKREEYRKT